MRKATLEGNIILKAKGRILVDGYQAADIMAITRDVIAHTVGVIELPDQTKVPGGRRRAGEFTVTIQFARDNDRTLFMDWAAKCIDGGTVSNGISPDYKRDMTIVYCRLLSKSGRVSDSTNGNLLNNITARILGCWVSSYNLPDYDMNSDEGDGDSTMECTIQYDDVIPDFYPGGQNAIGNTSSVRDNVFSNAGGDPISGGGLTF